MELQSALTFRYKGSYPLYAKQCLKIRTKAGPTVALRFNRSQQYVHDKVEAQRKRKGRVRIIVLKSRQVGISTYIAGRSYYKTTFKKGFRAYVLTHMDDATDNVFGMIKRFHDNVPDWVRPITGASNAKELIFSQMDSGYRVSTAGNKAGGRSHTLQVFHGSEVAFWPNAEDHVSGVLEAISDAPDTEVFLESTANGMGNVFQVMWAAAEEGKGDFECIFIPWYWHEEYARAPDEADWRPPAQFVEYQELYGLTLEQVYWAYMKNLQLSRAAGGRADEICWLFRREYPANAQEAFQTSASNSFIQGDFVMRARKATVTGQGAIVLGVDVARGGEDKSALIDRQGRRLGGNVCKKVDYGKDTMALVGEVVRTVREMRAQGLPLKKVVVDATGVGGPVFDVLYERLGALVEGVDFGSRPLQKERYANRRAEIWDLQRMWFMQDAGVSMADDAELHRDLCAPAWGDGQHCRFRSDGTLVMEEKPHMRKRLKFSPDYGDAAALTHAVDLSEFFERADLSPPRQAIEGGWML